MTPPHLLRYGHPNRPVSAEEVARPAYQMLIAALQHRGISEEEAALAIESLAQAHINDLALNGMTGAESSKTGSEAPLFKAIDTPPLEPVWMPVVSGLIWGCLTATTLLVLWWWKA